MNPVLELILVPLEQLVEGHWLFRVTSKMARKLDRRVEAVVPVEDANLRTRLGQSHWIARTNPEGLNGLRPYSSNVALLLRSDDQSCLI